MEDLGIGRPSTYAATIQTIGDRGYITHRGQYLVPTWLAFSVTRLLVENLAELVDYQFTAAMEADLDRIAAGEAKGTEWLHDFYFGLVEAQAWDAEEQAEKSENTFWPPKKASAFMYAVPLWEGEKVPTAPRSTRIF